ncbi:MAG: GAF domain-containing protein [Candidatus Velthaea sp.]
MTSERRIARSSVPSLFERELPGLAWGTEVDLAADRLKHIRDAYHLGRAPALQARRRIAASWNRCREANVDPNVKRAPIGDGFDDLLAANEQLLRAADPVIARLGDAFAGTGYVVMITDARGTMLDIAGDDDACRRVARLDVAPGCNLSECAVGTNAVGTALADGRAFQLLAGEHYCDVGQSLACAAAPISRPGTSEIIGTIDITGDYRLARAQLLPIVMQAAHDIEELLAFEFTPANARGE